MTNGKPCGPLTDSQWEHFPEIERPSMSFDCGHGHVHPRADGSKARCGGPAICSACARDAGRGGQELAR